MHVQDKLILDYVREKASFLVLTFDLDGNILTGNRYAKELLGKEVEGLTLKDIVVDFTGNMKLSDFQGDPGRVHLLNVGTVGGLPQTFYFRFFHADSQILAIGEVNSIELETLQKELVTVNNELGNLSRELQKKNAEQKKDAEQIESLLGEKELLLQEVHHRIKNNMLTTMGLLALHADTMSDSSAASALLDASSRLQSMMVLYDKLYRSSDFRKISTREYLTALAKEIMSNLSSRAPVEVETEIEDLVLDAKQLSSIGMILNELLTNAMKHAFQNREAGKISINLSTKESLATLTVGDDGIGIPPSIDLATATGFGFQVIRMLTEQLDGTIELERRNGSRFILEFSI